MNTNIGWTAQSQHGWLHDEGTPGNVFTEDQLPNAEVQRLAGINPEQYRAQHGLWVEPAAGATPEFVGTETGATPTEILASASNVESFMSSIPEPVEAVAEEVKEVPEESEKSE